MIKLRIPFVLTSFSLLTILAACSGSSASNEGSLESDAGPNATDGDASPRKPGPSDGGLLPDGAADDSGSPVVCAPAAAAACDAPVEVNPDNRDFSPMVAGVDHAGRAFAAGWSTPNGSTSASLFVARLTAAGAADTAFGTAGVTEIDLDDDTDNIPSIVRTDVDSLGRIVVLFSHVKVMSTKTKSSLVAVRLDEHGQLDGTFGTGGRSADIADADQTNLHDAALATVGDQTLVFSSIERIVDILALPEQVLEGIRLDAHGAIDPGYGFDQNAGSMQRTTAVSFAGGAYLSNGDRLWKLTTTGNIDPTFGTAGYVDGGVGAFSVFRDGRVLSTSGSEIEVLSSSGIGGWTVFAPKGGGQVSAERCDGKVASASILQTGNAMNGALINADGTLDPSRGVAGTMSCSAPSGTLNDATAIAVDSATGTATAFYVKNASAESLVAMRLHP